MKITGIAAVAAFILGLLVSGIAQSWRYEEQLAELRTQHANDLKAISDKALAQREQALAEQQKLQQAAAQADQQRTEELTHAQNENEQLRRQYLDAEGRASAASADAADARRRLRVQAKCAAAGSGSVPKADASGRVGDATTVELSDAAGQNVFDIRAGIIADQAKIRYLQDYARACSQ